MQIISTLRRTRQLIGIDELTDNDILHIYDVFDRKEINLMLKKGTPKYIVGDHYSWADPQEFSGLPLYVLPLYAEKDARLISQAKDHSNDINTNQCFNFIINKKLINRFLCIKFVEFFNLDNFDYTWSGVDQRFDMTDIIKELDMLGNQSPLDAEAKSFILSPLKLEKRIISFPSQTIDNVCISNYGGTIWTWNNGLNKLFLNSAISLITESVSHQKVSTFTEKTVYSVLGMTFPLWVGGGCYQAREWKKIGFDTFDDVIDHSYQSYNTLIERCYYAFAQNLEILSNIDKAKELRLIHKDRLLKNRELMMQNQLQKFIAKEIENYPEDLKTQMPKVLQYFGTTLN